MSEQNNSDTDDRWNNDSQQMREMEPCFCVGQPVAKEQVCEDCDGELTDDYMRENQWDVQRNTVELLMRQVGNKDELETMLGMLNSSDNEV